MLSFNWKKQKKKKKTLSWFNNILLSHTIICDNLYKKKKLFVTILLTDHGEEKLNINLIREQILAQEILITRIFYKIFEKQESKLWKIWKKCWEKRSLLKGWQSGINLVLKKKKVALILFGLVWRDSIGNTPFVRERERDKAIPSPTYFITKESNTWFCLYAEKVKRGKI